MSTVVIVGGGYAGVAAARSLRRAGLQVTLIERRSRHELLTLLPWVVAGTRTASEAALPYPRVLPRGVRFINAEAVSLDLENRLVETTNGSFAGDWLVLAAGAVPGFQGIPGAQKHGHTLRSLAGAENLRAALLRLQGTQPRSHVVVVGSGYTGTEIAGEIASWAPGVGTRDPFAVTLVAADRQLLAQGHTHLGTIAAGILQRKGVVMRLGVSVARVDERDVVLSSGEQLPADLLVWAVPSEISPTLRSQAASTSHDGRYMVNEYLQVARHRRVYAAGDIAAFRDPATSRLVAASGQLAVRAGKHVAINIVREATGLRPRRFYPVALGEAVSLGNGDGVADVFGLIVTGQSALAVKELALKRYFLTLSR